MKINWAVRFRNKNFWISLIPAIFLFLQSVLAPFGYDWDFGVLNQQITAIINAVFTILALLGIVTDPTTKGIGDSERALGYIKPNDN